LAGLIGLFATRPLSDRERGSVRDAARDLDFTGVSSRDVWEDDCLVVVRVHHDHTPPLPVHTDPRGMSVIFDGQPRLPDGAAPGAVGRWLSLHEQNGRDALARLDGGFAVVLRDARARRLTLGTDRFNSRPLYYHAGGDVLAFASQAGRLLCLPSVPRRLDPVAVKEFLAFQALVDERTFIADVRALPPSSTLDFPAAPPAPRRYWHWRPEADDGRSVQAHAERLTGPLVEATTRLIGDGRGLGLLLSGGLDSRAIVACATRPLPAVTLADFDNAEVRLARTIAGARGFPFTFVRRRPEHHVELVDLAVALGDGAHRYDNAQFALLRSVLPSEITALSTAYSFDRFLKGNSLPKRRRRLRGWPLQRHDLLPLPNALPPRALAETALAEHAHFLWSHAPLGEILRDPHRRALGGELRDILESLLRAHWDDCPDSTTRFEAVSFHMMFGRFPAYLNVLSIRHFFEDRVLAVDNALLDAIVATPPRLRLDGLAYRAALRRLAPDLWRIPDGNVGMRPGTHHLVLYARDRARELRRRAGLYRPPSLPDPAFTERSWPNMAEMIRHRTALAERMAKTLADPDALPPDLFDSAAVARLLEAHLAGEANHAWLLLLLLTFGTWHRRHLAGRPKDDWDGIAVGPPLLEVMR
jgi:hypothetical protein